MSDTKFEKDLVSGNVTKQLLIFALPFVISNVIQTLYSVVDMVIVGRYGELGSMSGVHIGGQVTFLLTNLVLGLSIGATTLIGQYLGAGDRESLKETIGAHLSVLTVLAVFFTGASILFRNPILRLLKTPVESYSKANDYLTITLAGLIFIFGYNALSAIMRGMGDSKRPLYFISFACLLNIVLDVVFVAGFKADTRGAAIATVISQAASMILCIIYLKKGNFVFDFKLSSFGLKWSRIKKILAVGGPTSIGSISVSFSFLFLTRFANELGVTEADAAGAAGKFVGFAILPGLAMGAAVAAMSAQNIGAGRSDRAVKVMKTGAITAMAFSVVMFAVCWIFPEQILRIFEPDNTAIIAAGTSYIKAYSFDFIFIPVVFSLNGLFNGSGHTVISLVNGLISSLIIRVPAAYLFGIVFDMGLFGIGLGAPAASFISMVLGMIFYATGVWKKSVIIKNDRKETPVYE